MTKQQRPGLLLCLLLPFVLLLVAPSQSLSQTPARRALVVSIDGLDARYLRRADEFGLKIPTLRRLMKEGAWARAGVVGIYPTLTYPSHATLVTGAWPARHGVYGNEVYDPSDPAANVGLWYADAAARARLTAGLVSWPVAAGAGDWNVPEIWSPGGTRRDALAATVKNSRPASLPSEIMAADPQLLSRSTEDEQDDMRTRIAEYVIERKRPALMLVHLFDFDHFQHDHGPFSPEAFRMLEKSDAYLGRLLEAARRAGTLGETAVFVVSDHGFLPVSRQIHPGVILARAGLLTVGERPGPDGSPRPYVSAHEAMFYPTAGSCAVYVRDEKPATLRRVRKALEDGATQDGRRVYRVLGRAELRRLHADPRAAFMLEASDGYFFEKNLTGEPVIDSKLRGQHGFLPSHADYRASLVASGPDIARGRDLGLVRMIDIAPTVARTLGLELRDADGRPVRLR
jgi:predicted AlkP superfamily pyrophosphatase or phosphodiesterase